MEYRKLKHRTVWHFVDTCQHWRRMIPGTYVSVEVAGRPGSGDLCNECRAKERKAK